MNKELGNIVTLGIESSCDDTSCAILRGTKLLANIIANQEIHREYGGVVPELASRSHLKNIIPLLDFTLKKAKVNLSEIDLVAYTRGPGLTGSLLVGSSVAKSLSIALQKPLVEVNHMHAHILAHFIQRENSINKIPDFPFLCLTVSGGHTQLVRVDGFQSFVLLGETIDDAVGEAFDKGAKILNLPYPGGPLIDQYSKKGNPRTFKFSKPNVAELNFSFSGLKTSLLYFIRSQSEKDSNFIENNLFDICASYQHTITEILIEKLVQAIEQTNIKQIAIAGGVSANSELRKKILEIKDQYGCKVFIPEFEFCTDNAAMIAITGYYKFLNNELAGVGATPLARWKI